MTRTIPYENQLHAGTVAFLDKQPHKLLIGGRWATSVSGKTFTTYEPSTGQPLAEACEAQKEDVNSAGLASDIKSVWVGL